MSKKHVPTRPERLREVIKKLRGHDYLYHMGRVRMAQIVESVALELEAETALPDVKTGQ